MKKGYITVFFALIFMVLVSFIVSIFHGVKINAMRLKAECAFSVAENSVLGEYHTELLEMFDLFYVDTSYRTDFPDYHQVEAHLWKYLEENYTDAPTSVEISQITMATDNQGTSYRKQISSYMKDKLGISYVEQLTNLFESVSSEDILQADFETENIWEENWQKTLGQIEEIPEETWEKVEKVCPLKEMSSARNSFVLQQVISDKSCISKKEVNIGNLASNRTLIKGTGTDEQLTFSDKIYFIGYVFEKFSYYSKETTQNPLDYKIEYLLGGKSSDYENLSSVAKQILMIRETINLTYLLTDSEKMSLLEEVSTALATLIACPELAPVFQVLFVGLWSYAESIVDVKILFDGGKIPLVKSEDNWNTDLDSGFGLDFTDSSNETSQEGMDYKQYLELLLLFTNNEKITYRSMDLIEMQIRQTEGNEGFRMDGCADDFLLNIVFDIPLFGDYQIVRKFGYF